MQGEDGRGDRGRTGGRCPVCGKAGRIDFRPFCSKRCADVDLGRWLSGRYAIPGEPAADAGDDDPGGSRNG